MGVLGLTPFLQKSFPEVVKQLPDRLRGLAGKKIVIDGTLITQRLHFAQVPHDYRHVLGWYKLVKELEESGVSAICVFDGKERSLAKSREAERRREVRRLAIARGSIELDRVNRLNRLVDVLHRFKKLDVIQKGRVSELLQQISSEQDFPSSSASTLVPEPIRDMDWERIQHVAPVDHLDEQPQEEAIEIPVAPPPSQEASSKSTSTYNDDLPLELSSPTSAPPPSTPPLPSVSLPSVSPSNAKIAPQDLPNDGPALEPPAEEEEISFPVSQLPSSITQESIEADLPPPSVPLPISPPSTPPTSPASRPSAPSASQTLPSLDRPFPSTPIRSIPNTEPPSTMADITVAAVASLYFDFRDSVRKLASLTPVAPDVLPHSTDAEEQDARVEYSMTKSQMQLTADEAKLWEELTSPASEPSSPESQSPEEFLSVLAHRADVMSQSYQRRTNPPTPQTYDESKELLQAMGVPCIDTTGTYEAEALASALVIKGYGDYVVSEDTDVVVYEAPLIRNITNRNGPLMLLSGSEIRTALQLDRSSFIDFALLLGTDFSQRIKNVGPARALKFMRQHKSIERIIEAETKYAPRVPAPAYLAEVELARLVFQTLPPVPDEIFLKQVKDEEGLAVLLERFGLGKLLMTDDGWDFTEALQGNYYSDNPSADA